MGVELRWENQSPCSKSGWWSNSTARVLRSSIRPPQAFLSNAEVYRLVREQQLAALPITAVNGRVIKAGAYPTLAEVQAALDGQL